MVNRLAHLFNDPMPRPPKRKRQLGTYIPETVYDAVADYSEESGIPITRIVEDALRMYLGNNYWPIEGEEAPRKA